MKKKFLVVLLASLTVFVGCKNNDGDETTKSSTSISTSTTEEKNWLSIRGGSPTYKDDNTIEISGLAKPESDVIVSLKSDRKEITRVKADKDGNFTISFIEPNEKDDYLFENLKEKTFITLYSKEAFDMREEIERKEKEKIEQEKIEKQKEEERKVEEERIQREKEEAEKKAREEAEIKKQQEEQAKRDAVNNAPREHRNALKTAKDYLNYSSFSKTGLYEQLLFEEYPAEAAQFAIDNIEVDWNSEALKTAKSYLDYSSFSDSGLYDQLLFEGFTNEQAQYAIDNLPN
ncbi:Ltp family lipoprotein [Vagococcus fluvialis]|uniref:Ltp family lipoprotein n=1 Tax=Vagococcus fluvialis TaxID=2738 RepID=UPI001F5CD6D6|nr:Ltp family lipoprotein [Vagococcus fluvialis]